MAEDSAADIYLFLQGMDGADFHRYRNRLNHIFDIVDTAQDVFIDKKTNEGVYRLNIIEEDAPADTEPEYHEVRVSIVEMDNAPAPVFRISATHTDFVADFTINEPLRKGEKQPDPGNYDDVLDIIERWIAETSQAFTKRGHIGASRLELVQEDEEAVIELLNALVHAYIEFKEGDQFQISAGSMHPYAANQYHQIVEDERFEFLSKGTKQALDEMLPVVIKLSYTASQSLTQYWLCPADPRTLTVTAATLPEEAELVEILKQVIDIPAPHILEEPILISD